METPLNLKYTKDHEWISIDGKIATVGITGQAYKPFKKTQDGLYFYFS